MNKVTFSFMLNKEQYENNKSTVEGYLKRKSCIGEMSNDDVVSVIYDFKHNLDLNESFTTIQLFKALARSTNNKIRVDLLELYRVTQDLKDIIQRLESITKTTRWKRFKAWLKITFTKERYRKHD